jgi:hypothetical protein
MKDYSAKQNDPDAVKIWDTNIERYTKAGALYAVGAICDMTAMCMMMTAVGVKRYEAMKSAIAPAMKQQKKNPVSEDNATGDRVYIYPTSEYSKDFEEDLTSWCQQKGSGLVQFKFKCPDWHTFALERVWDKDTDKEPSFLVYQSYQNTYRLLDFLGLGTKEEQAAQMKRVWDEPGFIRTKCKTLEEYLSKATSAQDEKQRRKWWNSLNKTTGCKSLDEFTQQALEKILNTVKSVGGGIPLTLAHTMQYVITPLADMVAGKLPLENYVRLTGSSMKTEHVKSERMGVLMCGKVSPGEFKANYEELLKSEEVTSYPYFDVR